MQWLLVIAALLFAGSNTSPESHLEYEVKGAFLFNFLKFVDWPDAAGGTPLVVGILGRDPFGSYLENAVLNKKANGRQVVVRRFARRADARDCNLLFIPDGEFRRSGVGVIPGVMTVGESPGFLEAGGVISFYIEKDRVRFEISPESARASGLRVSAQLLKLGSGR